MIKLSGCESARWADLAADPPSLPAGASADAPPAADLSAPVDERTAAYVAGMREPFERLRQAEAQLAGLLVLAAAGGQAIAGHPMLALAADAVAEAVDAIRSIAVPALARCHRAHVLEAMRDLRRALAAARCCLARRDDAAIDAVLAPLRGAHGHLLRATAALPGFEVVALSQACCAQHAMPRRPSHEPGNRRNGYLPCPTIRSESWSTARSRTAPRA